MVFWTWEITCIWLFSGAVRSQSPWKPCCTFKHCDKLLQLIPFSELGENKAVSHAPSTPRSQAQLAVFACFLFDFWGGTLRAEAAKKKQQNGYKLVGQFWSAYLIFVWIEKDYRHPILWGNSIPPVDRYRTNEPVWHFREGTGSPDTPAWMVLPRPTAGGSPCPSPVPGVPLHPHLPQPCTLLASTHSSWAETCAAAAEVRAPLRRPLGRLPAGRKLWRTTPQCTISASFCILAQVQSCYWFQK